MLPLPTSAVGAKGGGELNMKYINSTTKGPIATIVYNIFRLGTIVGSKSAPIVLSLALRLGTVLRY